MTYDGYLKRETSENNSYRILKPKKKLRGVRRDKGKNQKHTTLECSSRYWILSSTEQKHGRRRVLAAMDPFLPLILLPAHIEQRVRSARQALTSF